MRDTFQQEGIDSDIYWIGNKPIGGCIGCFQCAKKQKCVFDDKINEFTKLAAAAEYDGFIFGSPVYYSGMNGSLMSFMDRAFFSASAQARIRSGSSRQRPSYQPEEPEQLPHWIRSISISCISRCP